MKRLVVLSICCVALAGCGTQAALLGTEGEALLTAYDALAPPGEAVPLRARLQAGDLLQGLPRRTVRFYLDGRLYGAARTDAEGIALIEFEPEGEGDYIFLVDAAPTGFSARPPQPQRCVVSCRPADAPLVVVDLDKTLVASGFQEVLLGEPEAMADSRRVMSRLAEEYAIFYLTHRPDTLGTKSRQWLARQGYPTAPLILSDLSGFLAGSEEFKSQKLNEIRRDFTDIRLGIGDKISDARAYHATGTQAYLVVMPADYKSPAVLRELAEEIRRELPEAAQVVTGWDEVARGVFEGERFPPERMVEQLRRRASELETPAGSGDEAADAKGSDR